MSHLLSEAFQKLELLNEETFSINSDGIGDFIDFVEDDDDDDRIDIIDAEAHEQEDLNDSYEGKLILDCCVCHSKQYKDIEDVVIEDDVANADEECPFCYSTDGFKVIGQVAPFNHEDSEEEKDENSEEPDSTEEEKDEKEDSLQEGITDMSINTDDTHMEMTSDDSGKVTIVTEPLETEETQDGDTIEPVGVDVQDEVESNVEDGAEISIDEFDEESFDELGESYLRHIYENVNSYRTKCARCVGGNLIIEGVIRFTSGSEKKTKFIFENRDITKKGKLKLSGGNSDLTQNKRAFTVVGSFNDHKFIAESFNYNYGVKGPSSKLKRLYGTIRK